jgi:hypothetical protein
MPIHKLPIYYKWGIFLQKNRRNIYLRRRGKNSTTLRKLIGDFIKNNLFALLCQPNPSRGPN